MQAIVHFSSPSLSTIVPLCHLQFEVENYFINLVGGICCPALLPTPAARQMQACVADTVGQHVFAPCGAASLLCDPTICVFACCRRSCPQGFLLPGYHGNYWLGLRALGWPAFGWVDPVVPQPSEETYSHWGSDGDRAEPNNLMPQESCGAGNYSEAYDGIFGWADTRCTNSFVFMCKVMREWPLVPTALGASPA